MSPHRAPSSALLSHVTHPGCTPPDSHVQVHTWRQEVLHGSLPETQPAPSGTASGGPNAPLLTDGSGNGKEEGDGKGSRASTPQGQQLVSPADGRPEPAAAKERAVLSAADASALPAPDKVPHSKSRWVPLPGSSCGRCDLRGAGARCCRCWC